MNVNRFKTYDAADFLCNEEAIAAYLEVAAEDPDPDTLQTAMANVARAREKHGLVKKAAKLAPSAAAV